MINLYKKRIHYKPFENPKVLDFIKLMNFTYWTHDELDFFEDKHHFKTLLDNREREVLKRSLLSISQIEISVKLFWGKLYEIFPKPEFNGLGATFAESEWRHSEAYSRLLEELGYEDEFEKLVQIPIFKERLDLIDTEMKSDDAFERILFFTIVVENSSLFTQFANILSFNKFNGGAMKNVANIISWTSIDENVHKEAGVYILSEMLKEGHSMNEEKLRTNILKYVDIESRLLDWIYENGELTFFTKEDMLNFLKHRIDDCIIRLGYSSIFNISKDQLAPMKWFDDEIYAMSSDDFHAVRPVAYSNHNGSITSSDLF